MDINKLMYTELKKGYVQHIRKNAVRLIVTDKTKTNYIRSSPVTETLALSIQ
jgi:hypothetical protein